VVVVLQLQCFQCYFFSDEELKDADVSSKPVWSTQLLGARQQGGALHFRVAAQLQGQPGEVGGAQTP
jgi:hypothetical protein